LKKIKSHPDQPVTEDILRSVSEMRPAHPAFMDNYTYTLTCSLYLFAREFCSGKNVLDAACGYGYGSALIREAGSSVTGVDLSREAIAYARTRYLRPSIKFQEMDATDLKFDRNTFDTVVSIETFEHLPPEKTECFLASVRRVLKPGGILVLSTPVRSVYDQISKTPDHINEVEAEEFIRLFKSHFNNPCFYLSQKNALKSRKMALMISSRDSLGLRRLIPERIRKRLKRGLAVGLRHDLREMLNYWHVEPVSDPEVLKTAIYQIVVCENRKAI
jgi:2-polyprenyl-3-methyl-5-hydroxy-6-metoxy-1,4-benzoquinol methylase